MRALVAAAVLVMLAVDPDPATGQVAAERQDVFAKLQGQWTGSGVLMGRPAEFSMRWEAEGRPFVRLTFHNAWTGEDGGRIPVLTSVATYYLVGGAALGVWIDDRPQRIRLEAALTDSTVVTEWTADAERGRTEYIVRSADEVLVRDVVYADGSERLFAEATYHRSATSRVR